MLHAARSRLGQTIVIAAFALVAISGCGAEEPEQQDLRAEDEELPFGLNVEQNAGEDDSAHDDVGGNSPEPDAAPEPDVAPEPDPDQAPPDEPPPDEPPPGNGAQQCTVWQDCGPLFDDPNSGFDCVQGSCQCDATGQWSQTCGGMGGFWVASACQCVFSDLPPPNYEPNDNCWWDLYQPTCDADRWIDTSSYVDECYYDANNDYRCDAVWVDSGYYEPGACPDPYWLERC